MSDAPNPLDGDSPIDWDADGVPRSRLFGDIYYSTADGLAESRAVFLAGCGLPEAWRGRRAFTVGELGFGSGLNIIALLALWRETREPGARLRIFSIEAFPMSRDDARRALATWPELGDLARSLVDQWPRRARGFHRIDFEDLGAVLDLAIMDVHEALTAWTGAADAWFLDGFSPARNPAMWADEVLAAVAARSAPGARAATFTVAGAVRRGLAAAGFTVEKRPGFGRKSERLEARLPGPAIVVAPPETPRVAIIGAGIAGASLARAFRALGAEPLVIDAAAPGASGNAAALSMARLDAGGEAVAQLYAQAMARAADLHGRDGAVIARGVLQLEVGPKDPSRFDRIAAGPLFERGAVARLSVREVEAALGEPAAAGGLMIRDALVVEPAVILGRWLAGVDRLRAEVAAIAPDGDAWRLIDGQGREIARAEIVCVAAGAGTAALAPNLPISPVRGQISLIETPTPPAAAIGAGYVIPTRTGFLIGATHDRGDGSTEVRAEDHRRNIDLVAQARPRLAASLDPGGLRGRAGVRAVTPDFLPLAGPIGPAGPYILCGLGSRGFCAAPLLAEHVAALALGIASPLPRSLGDIVDPRRFERRRARRFGRSMPGTGLDRVQR
ncbi:MAG TPA: tRNA (5-methylaminomethyl-2-thiouridine)(34)-methyltransferase MnmD [Caulobacteraceae bacterium]|jgi:tRNA 5-methylaminomethyl-2-thiouridine biosynthesis bifunctional protein|nr:tRNA (5-methylaminomethyl-2-thiouridine)(34)-methyltransferase MnmD [Caulobacteraceae bacterium]